MCVEYKGGLGVYRWLVCAVYRWLMCVDGVVYRWLKLLPRISLQSQIEMCSSTPPLVSSGL